MHIFAKHNPRITSKHHPRIAGAPIAALVFAALAAAALTGCANRSMSSQTFPRSSAQSVWNVEYGEIVDVRAVEIEGEFPLLGVLIGSAIGHAAGTEISDSSNAGVVGGVVGAVAGGSIEHAASSTNGLQITVDLDSGRTVAIVQDDGEQFQDGERVRVLTAPVAAVHPAVLGGPGVWGPSGVFGGPRGVGPVGSAHVPMTVARVQSL